MRRFSQELIADVFHAATGIVHQNIEPPEPLDRGVDNLSAVAFLLDVGDKRENLGFAAALPDLFCDGFNLVRSRAAVATTWIPACVSPRTIARPSPRPPPVTMATCLRIWLVFTSGSIDSPPFQGLASKASVRS